MLHTYHQLLANTYTLLTMSLSVTDSNTDTLRCIHTTPLAVYPASAGDVGVLTLYVPTPLPQPGGRAQGGRAYGSPCAAPSHQLGGDSLQCPTGGHRVWPGQRCDTGRVPHGCVKPGVKPAATVVFSPKSLPTSQKVHPSVLLFELTPSLFKKKKNHHQTTDKLALCIFLVNIKSN